MKLLKLSTFYLITNFIFSVFYPGKNVTYGQQLELGNPKSNAGVITYTDLPTLEQRMAWNEMHQEWLSQYFTNCLNQYNIKLSCASCPSIYLTVDFHIDSNGRVIDYVVVKEKMCGKAFTDELIACFLEYFLIAVFPEGLRNMIFEITIGNGLKC